MKYKSMPVGQMMVAFEIKDLASGFDLPSAARRLAKVAEEINWQYGRAGFVGHDYSFCIYYNHRPGRFVLAWYYFRQFFKVLFTRKGKENE